MPTYKPLSEFHFSLFQEVLVVAMKRHSSYFLLWGAWLTEGPSESRFETPSGSISVFLLSPQFPWATPSLWLSMYGPFLPELGDFDSRTPHQPGRNFLELCWVWASPLHSFLFSSSPGSDLLYDLKALPTFIFHRHSPLINLLQIILIPYWHLLFRGPEPEQFSKLSSFPFPPPLPLFRCVLLLPHTTAKAPNE